MVLKMIKVSRALSLTETGSSLVARWFGFRAFTSVAWVQSLIRELRFYKQKKKKKKKKKNKKNEKRKI